MSSKPEKLVDQLLGEGSGEIGNLDPTLNDPEFTDETDEKTAVVDVSGVETADDGNTLHYGGMYTVNGKEFQAHGSDRDSSMEVEMFDAVVGALGLIEDQLSDEETDYIGDKILDLLCVIDTTEPQTFTFKQPLAHPAGNDGEELPSSSAEQARQDHEYDAEMDRRLEGGQE